jgi:hypothetical protein
MDTTNDTTHASTSNFQVVEPLSLMLPMSSDCPSDCSAAANSTPTQPPRTPPPPTEANMKLVTPQPAAEGNIGPAIPNNSMTMTMTYLSQSLFSAMDINIEHDSESLKLHQGCQKQLKLVLCRMRLHV